MNLTQKLISLSHFKNRKTLKIKSKFSTYKISMTLILLTSKVELNCYTMDNFTDIYRRLKSNLKVNNFLLKSEIDITHYICVYFIICLPKN